MNDIMSMEEHQKLLLQTKMNVQYRERIPVGTGWGPVISRSMTVERACAAKEAERQVLLSRCGTIRPSEGLFFFRTYPGEEWIVGGFGDPVQLLLSGLVTKV